MKRLFLALLIPAVLPAQVFWGTSNAKKLQGINICSDAPANANALMFDSADNCWKPAEPPGASGGEANTASNVGAGIGVFKVKSVLDLQFKSLQATHNLLTIAANADTNHVDFTINTANFPVASGSQAGLLSAANWTTFNGKYGSGAHAALGSATITPPDDRQAATLRGFDSTQTNYILELQTEANAFRRGFLYSGAEDVLAISTPGTNPSAGVFRWYFKTGTGLCWIDSAGTETCASSGAGLSCAFSRTDDTNLDASSCEFTFPNIDPVSLTNVNVSVASGTGNIYLYALNDGEVKAGTDGTVAITCTNCTDVGAVTGFPVGSVKLYKWAVSAAVLAADDGSQNLRRSIVGPVTLVAGAGISIEPSGADQEVAYDPQTAVIYDESTHQAVGVNSAAAAAQTVGGWVVPNSGGAAVSSTGTAPFRIGFLSFADAATNAALFYWHIPSTYVAATTIAYKFHAFVGSGATAAQIAKVRHSWVCMTQGEVYFSTGPTFGSTTVVDVTAEDATEGVNFTINADLTGCAANETLVLLLERLGSDAGDTWTATLNILSLSVGHYRYMQP